MYSSPIIWHISVIVLSFSSLSICIDRTVFGFFGAGSPDEVALSVNDFGHVISHYSKLSEPDLFHTRLKQNYGSDLVEILQIIVYDTWHGRSDAISWGGLFIFRPLSDLVNSIYLTFLKFAKRFPNLASDEMLLN